MTKGGSIKEKVLGSKELRIILTENGTITHDVASSKRKSYCLGASELMQLTNLANIVEKHYGSSMGCRVGALRG